MKTNFGEIKNIITEAFIKSINSRNDIKKIFESFLKQVKSSDILKKEYIIFNNLSNKFIENKDSAYRYINENILLLSKYTNKQIIKENEMLVSNIISELDRLINYYERISKINSEKKQFADDKGEKLALTTFTNAMDMVVYDLKELKSKLDINTLEESIDSKIFNLIIENNVDDLHKSKESLIEHLTTKKDIIKESIVKSDYPIEKLIESATEKFNEKYSFLNEEEQSILKAFLNESDEEKKEIYSKLIKESKKTIKRRLMENKELWEGDNSNIELINKLELTELKLKTLKYNNSSINEFIKLIGLRNELLK